MNNNNRGNNSNNNNNNRRRGRGNNRQGGGGGGQQLNRIDSRARGNAPQMLEKYRKLAHDAHLNGDRVAEEYNLQFAEHYFRVIADQRLRQEEQRGGGARPNDRFDGENGERSEQDDGGEYAEAEYQPYDQSAYQRPQQREERPQQERQPREERPRREDRPERQNQERQGQGQDRPERAERPERQERNFNRAERTTEESVDEAPVAETAAQGVGEPAFEPPENPFVRGSRGLKPRREDRRPRREERDDNDAGETANQPEGLSLSLPPAISASRAEPEAEAEEAPKPKARRAPRKPKPSADGETLEAVS